MNDFEVLLIWVTVILLLILSFFGLVSYMRHSKKWVGTREGVFQLHKFYTLAALVLVIFTGLFTRSLSTTIFVAVLFSLVIGLSLVMGHLTHRISEQTGANKQMGNLHDLLMGILRKGK